MSLTECSFQTDGQVCRPGRLFSREHLDPARQRNTMNSQIELKAMWLSNTQPLYCENPTQGGRAGKRKHDPRESALGSERHKMTAKYNQANRPPCLAKMATAGVQNQQMRRSESRAQTAYLQRANKCVSVRAFAIPERTLMGNILGDCSAQHTCCIQQSRVGPFLHSMHT